jgi:hypothetical protein
VGSSISTAAEAQEDEEERLQTSLLLTYDWIVGIHQTSK